MRLVYARSWTLGSFCDCSFHLYISKSNKTWMLKYKYNWYFINHQHIYNVCHPLQEIKSCKSKIVFWYLQDVQRKRVLWYYFDLMWNFLTCSILFLPLQQTLFLWYSENFCICSWLIWTRKLSIFEKRTKCFFDEVQFL